MNKYTNQNMTKPIFKTFLLSLTIVAQVHFAFAQTASILPPAETTFVDQNGKPLTGGKVDFYIPSTTTRKTTWQDAAETIPNTNPVTLDSAGRALILGSGSYRQVVKDKNGNLIWDQVTSSTGSGGGTPSTSTGDGDLVGTIKPWAGLAAPNQYMFTYGQEISRTTYAALYTAIVSQQAAFCTSGSPTLTGIGNTTNIPIGAKVEVSCVVSGSSTVISKTSNSITLAANANININLTANIYPWGNGNGSTTFNLPDFRGLIPVGNNNMGGVASSNLTTTYFGSADPNSIGGAGGSQSTTIIVNNLPPYTPAGTIAGTIPASSVAFNVSAGGTGLLESLSTTAITATFTGTPQGGTSVPFSRIQPSKTVNYIIKVTPDTNSATASGVTSLGLMIGDIACGAGILCTGNTITASNVASGCTTAGTFSVGTGGSSQCSDTAASAALLNGGPLAINPTAATTTKGFNISQTGPASGTQTAFDFNAITIASDQGNTNGATNVANGLNILYEAGGSNLQGSRQGGEAQIVRIGATNASNPNRNFVGWTSVCTDQTGDGGTNTGAGAKGGCFGGNDVAQSSGANTYTVTGREIDVGIVSGSASYRWGNSAISIPNTQAALLDAAFVVGSAAGSGAIGWLNGYVVTDVNSGGTISPISSGGCVICTSLTGSYSITTGIDLSGFTFTGNLLNFNKFQVTSAGTINSSPTAASTTKGLNVSQSGPASGSQAAFNLNAITVASDQANTTLATALNVSLTSGGSNLQGARESLVGSFNLSSPSSASNANRNYVGVTGQCVASSSDNGTGTGINTGAGACYGMQSVAQAGASATNLLKVVGIENDVSITTGGTSAYRFGDSSVSNGTTLGATGDAAFHLSSIGGNGWTNGLYLSNASGARPITTAGCVICTDATANTITTGIDLSAYTLTGNALKFKQFVVSGVNGHMQVGIPSTAIGTSDYGFHISTSQGSFTLDGVTPGITLLDTNLVNQSHGANINVFAYDSANNLVATPAIQINPGLNFINAGHVQSDIDISGIIDGKGLTGLLNINTGCTVVGNGCGQYFNPSFFPVGDAQAANLNAPFVAVAISNTANNGSGNIRLTVSSTSQFTSGMYCSILYVNGTTEANGRHTCTVIDGTHLDLDFAFTHAFSSTVSFTGTGVGTNLTVTGLTGYLAPGASITGTGVPGGTTIASCPAATGCNSNGVFVTSGPTTASGASLTGGNASVVGVTTPWDLGTITSAWNDFWQGGNLYQGFVGAGVVPLVSGYQVIAQNSCSFADCAGDMIRQYVNSTEVFRIQTANTGTTFGTISNTGLTFQTNSALVMALSTAGGLTVGATTAALNSTLMLKEQAFGSLSACSSSFKGSIASISDSNTITWGATIAGSSTNHVLGYCDGTNWTVAAK